MQRSICVEFQHRVLFTQDVLSPVNPLLADCLEAGNGPARVLAFLDTHVSNAAADLPDRLRAYAAAHAERLTLTDRVQPVVGGEACKNDRDAMYRILETIDRNRIDRQSYVLAIGGGAVLDCVGFAAAIAHRGVRLVRMPTTTLAQADSGVGVKNGINGFGRKNFLGSFAVPWAVVNDAAFLQTLPDREWRSGFAEAVKVALVKDAAFFQHIEQSAERIAARDPAAAMPIIQRSAELHLDHIARGGDPFELTEARPLDFGHWSAHQLEVMTDYTLRHGEAVAIGVALDALYSQEIALLDSASTGRILKVLRQLRFNLEHEALRRENELLAGLEEFREHLGGRLTITLLKGIGRPLDIHEIDEPAMRAAVRKLAALSAVPLMR